MKIIIVLVSLAIEPYIPQGVYVEIYPSIGGNIDRVKKLYFIFWTDILLNMENVELTILLNFDMSRFYICRKVLLTGILPSLLSEMKIERNIIL